MTNTQEAKRASNQGPRKRSKLPEVNGDKVLLFDDLNRPSVTVDFTKRTMTFHGYPYWHGMR